MTHDPPALLAPRPAPVFFWGDSLVRQPGWLHDAVLALERLVNLARGLREHREGPVAVRQVKRRGLLPPGALAIAQPHHRGDLAWGIMLHRHVRDDVAILGAK